MKLGKIMVTLALVIIVAAASTAAFAGWGCCGGYGGPSREAGPAPAKLTDDQQRKAEALRLEFLKKTEPIRAEISKKRLELVDLAAKSDPDPATMEKKREEIWKLQDQIRAERREMGKQFRALLTPEQLRNLGPYAGGRGRGFGPGPWGRGWCPGPGGGPGYGGCPYRSGDI